MLMAKQVSTSSSADADGTGEAASTDDGEGVTSCAEAEEIRGLMLMSGIKSSKQLNDPAVALRVIEKQRRRVVESGGALAASEADELAKLALHCPHKLAEPRWTDPHTKVNVLLQCHFSRREVSRELTGDLHEVLDKAVRLDERVFGVLQPALGPFQRRLQEIGGIAPLVFGQYGELSASFEALIDTLAVKGCDQAADHYLLDVGPGAASVQKRLLRQRVNCCVARAQAGVLLRRLKFALPGWAQAERRRKDWRDQAAQRAAQARAYSGEGHSEEWRFEFSRSYPH